MPGSIVGVTGFIERQKGKGYVESSALQRLGKGGASVAGGGCLSAQLSAAGIGNGADVTADTLFSLILPANVFDIAGRNIEIIAWGNVTATSATKTVLLTWGAAGTGSGNASITAQAQWTTTQTGNWFMCLNVWKTASNVQIGVSTIDQIGATTARLVSVTNNGSETDTSPIKILLTGQSTAATANTVVANGMVVYGYN